MKIDTFHVDGYGVWSDLKIERLSESLNVFHGPNEAGKTTLLQFVRSMFYGFPPQRRRYFPPLHGGQPGGTIDVSGSNGRFQIKRIYAENNGVLGDQLTITAPDGMRQGEHFLKVLLSNVDEAVFNNVFAIGLREIQELNTLSDTDASEMLYNLTVGLDRVSLVEVLRELETSRNRLIDDQGRPCTVSQLLADRAKLLAEIEELSAANNRYSRLAAEHAGIDADAVRLEEEANQAERQCEIMDLAATVKDRWRRRAELDEHLEALETRGDMPERAIERLGSINARLEQRRKRIEAAAERREELRLEFKSLKINDLLQRQTARIEAVVEQEPWIARLQAEIGELEAEIGRLEAESAAEAVRLGLSEGCCSPPPSVLKSLRAPAREMQAARDRLNETKREAGEAQAAVDSIARQLQSSLSAHGGRDLDDAVKRAEDALRLSRKRSHIEEQIDRFTEYKTELEDRRRTLVDRQLLPGWVLIGLGAFFVLGAVLLLTGLFMPESLVGSAGLMLAILGGGGCCAAALTKVMLERSNARQLESCRVEIDQVRKQLAEAEEEQDSFEAGSNGESTAKGTKTAERELASLKELNPLAARRDASRAEAAEAQRRLEEARAALGSAKRRWRQTLSEAGLPADMSPKQLSRLVRDGGRIGEMQRRLNERREELARRRRELDSLASRVAQLADDAGMSNAMPHPTRGTPESVANPIDMIRALAEAAAQQQSAVVRRETIRRQASRIRAAAAGCEESAGRLQHRRRQLFIAAGVKTEDEYRRRALEYERAETLRDQRGSLDREIESTLAARCSPEAIGRQLDGDHTAALDERREETHRRLTALREKLAGLHENRGRLSEQLKSLSGDRRLAEKRLDLTVLEHRLREAVCRWRTLAVACRVLDAIRETYEQHRQPETLREASGYLERLTAGHYCRVWTPLGDNSLCVDDADGRALSVEALSRGTREQLFLALRLALAAAYARRGAPLPLVLDDVLVNYDAGRAKAAAAVLRDFAAAGHQLLVFTCHEHIHKLFKSLKTAVGILPDNSEPGGTITLQPPKAEAKPKQAKRSSPSRNAPTAKKNKPKPKPRKVAEIEVVEDDEEDDEELIEDEALWDEEDEDEEEEDDAEDAA